MRHTVPRANDWKIEVRILLTSKKLESKTPMTHGATNDVRIPNLKRPVLLDSGTFFFIHLLMTKLEREKAPR